MQANKDIQPPKGLLDKILFRIKEEAQAASFREWFMATAVLFVGILAAAWPVWLEFAADFSQSGFGEYARLIFSDFGSVVANWKDFGLNLLESLPVMSFVIFLSVIFGILLLSKFLIKYSEGFSFFKENSKN